MCTVSEPQGFGLRLKHRRVAKRRIHSVLVQWTMEDILLDTFLEICVNFPCKRADIKIMWGLMGIKQCWYFYLFFHFEFVLSLWLMAPRLCCGPQEPEENTQVPARVGAAAAGEDHQGAL